MVSAGVKAILSPSVRASSSLLGLDVPRGGCQKQMQGTLPTLSPHSQGVGGSKGVDLSSFFCFSLPGEHARSLKPPRPPSSALTDFVPSRLQSFVLLQTQPGPSSSTARHPLRPYERSRRGPSSTTGCSLMAQRTRYLLDAAQGKKSPADPSPGNHWVWARIFPKWAV